MNGSSAGDRSFVHLHVHSHFSLSDGVASVEALVRQAAALEMPALALTDHNSLAGLVTFLELCEANGIQPVAGCQLDILPGPGTALGGDLGSLVLLVESEIGYRNLAQLITRAQGKVLNGEPPHVSQQELGEHCAGLIALVGAASPIRHFLNPPDAAKIEEHLTDLVRTFGKENLFFELQPAETEERRSLNEHFIQLGEFLGIGIVATNDVHYLWPEDELAGLFLSGHRPPRMIGEKAVELGPKRCHLASAHEMRARFAFIPQAIANTRLIAERCRFRPQLRRRRLLVHDFARGFDAESHLWDLVFHCAGERYGVLDERIKSRLNEEFDYLNRHGLANYLQLLWRLAAFLSEQRLPCLVRRGAITTSLIAYVLGLTGIDPLAHHLAFEPLVVEGAVFPDVTLQVPARYLPRLCEYLEQSYGAEHVAQLGRYQYWPKALLLKAICQWAGLPKQKAEALIASEAISTRADRTLRWADLFSGGARPLPPHHPSTLGFIFNRLHPLPRALVGHDDRLVLSGEPIDQVVSLAYPEGKPATQLDATDCDALGLPRISLMASRPLGILDEAIGWIRRDTNRSFDLPRIEDGDAETFRLFSQGRTAGIPGFEGIGMRALLQRERPNNIARLIRVMTLSLGGQAPEERSPPGTVIADCLLAYRCAYVKAHHPVSFYTALLTQVCRNRRWLGRVLREMAQEGIRLLPVDINLSSYGFTQVTERIRAGLIVVNQMGEKAAAEINSVRRGGAFHSLLDFCRRTDPKLIPHRLIENLIKAGAMDTFGWRRSQMLATLDKAIEQPRSQSGRAAGSVQMQFEFPSLVTTTSEEDFEAPDVEELPLNLRLQYEVQASGYTTSADLLAPFAELIKRCRMDRAPVTLSQRLVGRELYLAGVVAQVEKATVPSPEEPAVWVDFDGVLSAVPEPLVEAHAPELRSNEPLMVGGTVACHENILFLRAHTIAPLIKIHQQAGQARQVVLDLENQTKPTLKALRQVCAQFPGPTPIVAVHYEASGRFTLRKLEASRVTVCPPLMNHLRNVLEAERVRVVGYGEE